MRWGMVDPRRYVAFGVRPAHRAGPQQHREAARRPGSRRRDRVGGSSRLEYTRRGARVGRGPREHRGRLRRLARPGRSAPARGECLSRRARGAGDSRSAPQRSGVAPRDRGGPPGHEGAGGAARGARCVGGSAAPGRASGDERPARGGRAAGHRSDGVPGETRGHSEAVRAGQALSKALFCPGRHGDPRGRGGLLGGADRHPPTGPLALGGGSRPRAPPLAPGHALARGGRLSAARDGPQHAPRVAAGSGLSRAGRRGAPRRVRARRRGGHAASRAPGPCAGRVERDSHRCQSAEEPRSRFGGGCDSESGQGLPGGFAGEDWQWRTRGRRPGASSGLARTRSSSL